MRPELRSMLTSVFDACPDSIDERSSPDTIPAWDSLGHLQLVAALESHYEVRFNLREIQSMDSVTNIEAVLRARGK